MDKTAEIYVYLYPLSFCFIHRDEHPGVEGDGRSPGGTWSLDVGYASRLRVEQGVLQEEA